MTALIIPRRLARTAAVLFWMPLALMVACPRAVATMPAPSMGMDVTFAPGSATLTPSDRKRIAEFVKQGSTRFPTMQVVVGTEASKDDNVALREARIDAVIKQLQADGVFPGVIGINLSDYDEIRASWLKTIADAHAAGLWIGPVDLRQRTEIGISISPGR